MTFHQSPNLPEALPSPSSQSQGKRVLPRGRSGKKNRRDPFAPTRTARIRITDADIPLFRLVDGHRLIDSRQLETVLLGNGNPRHFRDRLERLSDQEYLHRPPAQKKLRERRPMIYALGIRGRELLDKLDDVQRDGKRDWRLENDRLKLHFLEHEIAVTETVLALHMAAQQRGWSFEWWHDPRYIAAGVLPERVAIPAHHGPFGSLPLRPDSYVVVTRDDGHRLNLFVEVDRGTEPHDRASLQKMLAYWNYISTTVAAQAAEQRRQATAAHVPAAESWRLLIVTTTEGRAHNMRAMAQERVDPKKKGTHAFLITTREHCRIDLESPLRVFDEHIWWSTKIGYENPRKLFLDQCPKCYQLIDTGNESYVVLNAVPEPLACAPGTTLLPGYLPADIDPQYAHHACPGHGGN
jgi:hypothetical protein